MTVPSDLDPALSRRARRRRLAAATVLTVVLAAAPVGAQDDPDTIDGARGQREQARSEAAEAAAQLELLEAEDIQVRQALDSMDAAVDQQQARVDAVRADITMARRRLTRLRRAQAQTARRIVVVEERARSVAVEAYMGTADPAEIWLSSGDISESALEATYLQWAGGRVSDVFDELRRLRSDQDSAQAEAEALEDDLVAFAAELTDQLRVLEERQAVQAQIRAELLARIATVEARLDVLEAESAALTEWIKQETARQSAALTEPSGLGFVMPTAGQVGSGFGPRLHPILGYVRMHSGVDVSAGMGQTLVASNSGVIIWASERGGFGNTVIIDHGGGITSVSAHLSQIEATVGQWVERGEKVGEIGSTGMSTGPHLHFELRLWGEPQDPLRFLP